MERRCAGRRAEKRFFRSVNLMQSKQSCTLTHLPNDALDILERDSLVVGPDDEFEQIVSEYFKDHAHVGTVHASDFKIVQQLNGFVSFRVFGIGFSNLSINRILATGNQVDEEVLLTHFNNLISSSAVSV